MGKMILNFNGTIKIKDLNNKIESITTFSYKDSSFSFKEFFKFSFSKKEENLDNFYIQISQNKNKQKEIVSEGFGCWTGQLYFDNKLYWQYDDEYSPWKQRDLYLLDSDSTKREDLILIREKNWTQAQKAKDMLENQQRNDAKLRKNKK